MKNSFYPAESDGYISSYIGHSWLEVGRDGVSNHQRLDCLFNCLFRRRSKKTSKFRVTGLCEGNSPMTGVLPSQRASNAKNVSIWWRHHAVVRCRYLSWVQNLIEINSLTPGKCGIDSWALLTKLLSCEYHKALADKSTLVQAMVWCRQATSYFLSRSVPLYGVTRPQWVSFGYFWNYYSIFPVNLLQPIRR